jgi:hypothetical protein
MPRLKLLWLPFRFNFWSWLSDPIALYPMDADGHSAPGTALLAWSAGPPAGVLQLIDI